jgi:hypothetical protein
MGHANRKRAELYALAEFYIWCARRGHRPVGNDPRTGQPWPFTDGLARRIGRAENLAAAKVCYETARQLPCPLP